MHISLRPITQDNWRECINLRPTDAQQDWVASNVLSLAVVYVEPTMIPRAIYADEVMVGFVMYGRDFDDGKDWIVRLMIDREYQGKGYGKAAVQETIRILTEDPDCTEIWISYRPENVVAERLYSSLGFEPTGEIVEGEVFLRLAIAVPEP